ncbi:hypothetical protein [Bradyrhizobium guangzhouense]|uniref:Uncharacterized protein n=1 Tax=Bradyrhizobium guangzhouense TaxID=1325095 RepID=A0AAE6C6A4_9BRAD|nr:hypothetical protein [Bradyrhizobium guangzhouense]QAU44200.1 hypothetical protein XH91_01730 [Bradyrhizobium guangzhouense]
MATVLSFLSFFGILIGLTSVVFPLRFLYIRNRKAGSIVLAVSVVTFLPAAAIDGARQQAAALQEQTTPVPTPKSPAELAGELCKASGAIPNCREVLTRQIAEDRAHPKSPEVAATVVTPSGSCKTDWRRCSSNAELVNSFDDIGYGSVSCLYAAKKLAKYGTPSFPFLSFSDFRSDSDFVRTGVATLVEPNAEFQNGFGAMAHTIVTCKYDLASHRVVDLSID